MTMTKNEMREIIAKALPGHNWKHTSLPDFIADSIIDAQAQTGPLDTPTDEVDDLKRKLEEARAATPHFYDPSATGDCSICGLGPFARQHDTAQWKRRCEQAEATIAKIRAVLP